MSHCWWRASLFEEALELRPSCKRLGSLSLRRTAVAKPHSIMETKKSIPSACKLQTNGAWGKLGQTANGRECVGLTNGYARRVFGKSKP